MNRHRLGFLIVTLALSIFASAFVQDTAAMGDVDGDSDTAANAMGIKMCSGPHMVMTLSRPQTPNDIERAHDLIDMLRHALTKYHDSRVALSQGYQIFLPMFRRRFTISPTTAPHRRNTAAISIQPVPARCFT